MTVVLHLHPIVELAADTIELLSHTGAVLGTADRRT